jgi:futalosine hydrolase
VVSATEAEVAPTLDFLKKQTCISPAIFRFGNLEISVLVTGVGMVRTAFELGRLDDEVFDAAVNVGLAGSFDGVEPGTVLNVSKDRFAEMGAEDDTTFLSLDAMGFGHQEVSIKFPLALRCIESLQTAKGITVNTVHGNENSIASLMKRCNAEVESMEGAAFVYAASELGWQAAQIRCISNKVEKRDKSKWKIPLAIENLNKKILEIILELEKN